MTVIADAATETGPTPDVPQDEVTGTPTSATKAAEHRWSSRRAMIVSATAVALLVIAILGLQGPFGHVWYQSRQQNLAGDFNAKRPRSHKSQALSILQIPKINLNLLVVEGDGPTELRGGPGHRIGTPRPGEVGNSLIFGHRSGWGAPFSKVGQLQPKDQIIVKTRGQPLPIRFDVTSVTHVDQADVHLLTASNDHRITLITQTGGKFSTERVVVTAVSGDQGKLEAASHVAATSSHGSDILNATVGLFVLLVGASIFAVRELSQRHRTVMAVVVVMPLMAGALVAFLLEADLVLLPPLH